MSSVGQNFRYSFTITPLTLLLFYDRIKRRAFYFFQNAIAGPQIEYLSPQTGQYIITPRFYGITARVMLILPKLKKMEVFTMKKLISLLAVASSIAVIGAVFTGCSDSKKDNSTSSSSSSSLSDEKGDTSSKDGDSSKDNASSEADDSSNDDNSSNGGTSSKTGSSSKDKSSKSSEDPADEIEENYESDVFVDTTEENFDEMHEEDVLGIIGIWKQSGSDTVYTFNADGTGYYAKGSGEKKTFAYEDYDGFVQIVYDDSAKLNRFEYSIANSKLTIKNDQGKDEVYEKQ